MKKIYIEPQTEERRAVLDIVLIGSSEQDPWADAKDRDVYYEEEQEEEEFYLIHHNSSSNEKSLW